MGANLGLFVMTFKYVSGGIRSLAIWDRISSWIVFQWSMGNLSEPLIYQIMVWIISHNIAIQNYNMKSGDQIEQSNQVQAKLLTLQLNQSASSPSRIKLEQKRQQSPTQCLSTRVLNSYFHNPSPSDAPTSNLQQTPDFREHCKSCLRYQEERIDYETCIEDMSCKLDDQRKTVLGLEEQIRQLKVQEEYLMKTIEQMMEKQNNQTNNCDTKLEKLLKHKHEELNFANKEIIKLKEWLREEKSQVFRSIECVKMKDAIIQNLEVEVYKLKEKLAPRKKDRKASVIEERSQQDELRKHKERSTQLQEQIYELMEQVDNLRNENLNMKQQISNASKNEKRLTNSTHNESTKIQSNESHINEDEQIYSPIQKLINKKRRKTNGENTMNDNGQIHYRLLVSKCFTLENQIEKLLKKLQQLKMENLSLRQAKPIIKYSQQVADQPNIYF